MHMDGMGVVLGRGERSCSYVFSRQRVYDAVVYDHVKEYTYVPVYNNKICGRFLGRHTV